MADQQRPRLDLVRCYEGRAWEQDWIAFLLSDFDVTIHTSPDFSVVLPDALYVVLGSHGLGHVPAPFLKSVAAAGGCGLLHLGDEFLRGPYEAYASFDYVLRNFKASFLDAPGVLTYPLGYSNALPTHAVAPSSQRRYAWAFIGAQNKAREELGAAWAGFEPNFFQLSDIRAGVAHLGRDTFLDLLDSSAFMPCPMGNTQLETMRLYEVLERGTIPVLPRRRTSSYFEDMLGDDHPLPAFYTWTEARHFCEALYADAAELDAMQARIAGWWSRKKIDVRSAIVDFILDGRAGAFRAPLRETFARGAPAVQQVQRLVALVRQHDSRAMGARLRIAGARVARRLGLAPSKP
jgi:hypothetical protein